jgi:membrane fusion protein, multidrug efflux system
MIRSSNIGAALALAITLTHGDPVQAEPHPVTVHLAETASDSAVPLYAATLAPVQRATVSTRLAATVQKVLVTEGTRVKHGQLLVTLSNEEVQAQVAASTTALANATAYERRISELNSQRAATPVELESAQAQRVQATAGLAGTRANLAYTQLRAPFDGIVQARRVNVGDFVGPGQPLVEIEGAGLEVQATLSEEEAGSLHIGQKIKFEADGRHGEAEITALTPGGDALSHRRALRARVTDRESEFRSGAFVRMQIPGGVQTTQRRIPKTALVQRGDLTGVFVAENGHARLRWLSLGETSSNDVVVRAGLTPSESVIDAPGSLRDEQAVEIVNAR